MSTLNYRYELEKEASLGKTALTLGIAPILGVGYSGYNHNNAQENLVKALSNAQAVSQNYKLPERAGLNYIKNDKQLSDANSKMPEGFIKTVWQAVGEDALKNKNNAFFMNYGDHVKNQKDSILIPEGMPKQIIEHELGHHTDFRHNNSGKTLDQITASRDPGFLKKLINPTSRPEYVNEVKAWDNTEYKPGDPIRDAALGTYKAQAQNKSILTASGMSGAAGGVLGLLSLLRRRRR